MHTNIIVSAVYTQNPLVSVVIPSFNRAGAVGQTIDSILNQKCSFDYEIIIGDDCSTDNARTILLDYQRRYPNQIKLLFHESNIGLGANWASCIKECRGKYICNCDNDDYWHNDKKLQLQVEYLEVNCECGIVITNHRTHNRMTGEIHECKAYIDRSMPLQQAFFKGHANFCNATIMYRKSLIDEHLNLDDYLKYHFTLQDWNTWVILSAYSNIDIMDISTATFGVETESITRPKDYNNIIERHAQEVVCYKYVCDLFPNDLYFDQEGWDCYVNQLLLSMAYRKHDFLNAKKYGGAAKNKNLKVYCSKYRVFFEIYYNLTLLKRRLK